jgi:hypothetical protein
MANDRRTRRTDGTLSGRITGRWHRLFVFLAVIACVLPSAPLVTAAASSAVDAGASGADTEGRDESPNEGERGKGGPSEDPQDGDGAGDAVQRPTHTDPSARSRLARLVRLARLAERPAAGGGRRRTHATATDRGLHPDSGHSLRNGIGTALRC